MALDLHDIVKNDFAISRRGYEPEAVDKHLTGLAREVARLQFELDEAERSADPTGSGGAAAGATLADAASGHVRAIIEAAERSADEIRRSAEKDAERTRTSALSRSEEHVGSVGDAIGTLRGRVDEMERELTEMVDGLRAGADRLTSDLATLQDSLGDVYGAAGLPEPSAARGGKSASVGEPGSDEPMAAARAAEPEATALADEPLGAEPRAASAAEPEAAAETIDEESGLDETAPQVRRSASSAERRDTSGDVEGARLIALNMALNGQSRDETDTYLRETFDLDDRDGLLDEVYATVAG